MRPVYSVSIAGEKLPEDFIERLYSITVVDSAEQEGDTCEIAFDDRGPALPLPPDMAPVEVALGYEGQQLVNQGSYVIDEITINNGPRSLVVKAMATPVGRVAGAGVGATGPVRSLLGYIYAREGGYDSYNRGAAGDSPGAYPGGLTRLTIGQVMDMQARGEVFAVGAGQFIPDTLPIAANDAGLTRNDQFSPENQDRMTAALMLGGKRPALMRYLRGSSDDITAAHQDLCQEWAGVVCPSGRGFYDGDSAGNRGHGSVAEVQDALRASRAEVGAGVAAERAEQTQGASIEGNQAGTAAPRALIKEKRTHSYHDTTLAEIAAEIAERHGLQLNIEAGLGAVAIKHEDQTNESDQNFLTRLAEKHGLVIKPAEGALHVLPRGASALGGNLTLNQIQVTSWSARLKDRARFSKVRARYIDREDNKEKVVEVEGGEEAFPTHEVPELHRDEEEATAAAAAALQGLTSGYVEVTITMPGQPTVSAQGTVTLLDFHPEIDNEPWLIKRVTHTLNGEGGFTTTIVCGTAGAEPNRWGSNAPGGGDQPMGGQSDLDIVAFAPGQRPIVAWEKTDVFNSRGGRHAGNDYAMPTGTALSSRQGGKVLFVGNDPNGYGKFMDVQLSDGRVARMAHLDRTFVAPGKAFAPNQILANSGNTGRSTGPHLHFEDRTGGVARDPERLVLEFSADP